MTHRYAPLQISALKPFLTSPWIALVLVFAAITGTDTRAQVASTSLEPIKKMYIYGADPRPTSMASREAIWSPESLAWSPDGQRIAFSAHSVRPFGVIDLKTEKVTPIQTGFEGSGTVHWSANLNRLAVVQPIETSVYDMSGPEPKLLYVIQNKFPKVLQAIGASIVTVAGEDYLVLVGTTNWRVDKTNPHIAAYHLRTGERKWTYQFRNPAFDAMQPDGDTDFSPFKASATVNAKGDVLVAVDGRQSVSSAVGQSGHRSFKSEQAVWVINLTQGKQHCRIDIFASPTIQRNTYGSPWGNLYALAPDPGGKWLLISHTQFKNLYDLDTCSFRQSLDPELRVGADYSPAGWLALPSRKATASTTKVSPDGRWLVGYGPWAAKPDKAPLRLWRTADWSQALDATRISDGGTIDGEISRDGGHLAFAETNRLTIYRIKE